MMNEDIKATGTFSLLIYNEKGKLLESHVDKNLVVGNGRRNIAHLLGGDAAGSKISKIGCGTNATAPALGDMALTNAIIKGIDGVSYPDYNSVQINWSFDINEANGLTLREFGLMNDSGVLVARKVRSDIVKTSAVRLVGTWKITIN